MGNLELILNIKAPQLRLQYLDEQRLSDWKR